MGKQLTEKMMARIQMVRDFLSNTKTVPVKFRGEEYRAEYLMIPAMTSRGQAKLPIFIYPGGNTHLAPCFEPLLFLDREIIVISPLGYGWSSDIPSWIFRKYPLHGAEVALQVLKSLKKGEVELFVHSNAAPIGIEMTLLAYKFDIKISGIIMVNPLAIRHINWILVALAFPISGILTRIFSWGHENPFKSLKDAYMSQKHILSFWKIWYELKKSSKARLPEMFRAMWEKSLNIPITVVQSSYDWAAFHMPWTDSNEQILRENVPFGLLKIIKIPGLHNVTLGKDSRKLADIIM